MCRSSYPKVFFFLTVIVSLLLLGQKAAGNEQKLTELCSTSAAPCQRLLYEQYHEAWQLLRDNMLVAENSSLSEWEHRFDGQLTNQAELESAIKQLASSLHDEYTYFRGQSETLERQMEWNQKNIVSSHMRPDGTAYIRIRSFGPRYTSEETEAALSMMSQATGYILDLRDNRGGLIDEAHKVFALMQEKGTFTVIKGRKHSRAFEERLSLKTSQLVDTVNGITIKKKKRHLNLTGRRPIIILVNHNTGSAAEMLAGALKDHSRARLLGAQTYGKGIVQKTWVFGNGTSIKIAIGRYYLPQGTCINKIGVCPDFIVAETDKGDAQLDAAYQLLQSGMPVALSR